MKKVISSQEWAMPEIEYSTHKKKLDKKTLFDKIISDKVYARVAQLDRAFGYEPKGREFESCLARFLKRATF